MRLKDLHSELTISKGELRQMQLLSFMHENNQQSHVQETLAIIIKSQD